MFLRPEIVEQCAELVQFNASIFEENFRELIDALTDKYQPFRTWLFARLCSNKRKLIEPQLSRYICFGRNLAEKSVSNQGEHSKKEKNKENISRYYRSKQLIINKQEEYHHFDDDDNKTSKDNVCDIHISMIIDYINYINIQNKEFDLNRLMNAFRFCMRASNQLVINNQSRNYYELGIYLFIYMFIYFISLH